MSVESYPNTGSVAGPSPSVASAFICASTYQGVDAAVDLSSWYPTKS